MLFVYTDTINTCILDRRYTYILDRRDVTVFQVPRPVRILPSLFRRTRNQRTTNDGNMYIDALIDTINTEHVSNKKTHTRGFNCFLQEYYCVATIACSCIYTLSKLEIAVCTFQIHRIVRSYTYTRCSILSRNDIRIYLNTLTTTSIDLFAHISTSKCVVGINIQNHTQNKSNIKTPYFYSRPGCLPPVRVAEDIELVIGFKAALASTVFLSTAVPTAPLRRITLVRGTCAPPSSIIVCCLETHKSSHPMTSSL
mmetsp:Transcript_19777/g.29061  ORF Transcript_19777/g.29061 Transcript_19777/m.29061 type:complete len:254 (-) Transcript_19777:1198-1959(-)